MKHQVLMSLAAAAFLSGLSFTSEAAVPLIQRNNDNPLGRMRKVIPSARWSEARMPGKMKKVAPGQTLPASDSFQYLLGPDGSEWFATCTYDYETIELEGGYATENLLKGYTFTIYDNNFKEIGTIKDKITFEDGEVRCVQAMLDIAVTKKFFNYDDKYEVMVALCMNAQDYAMNYRTKVYSIGGQQSDGYDLPVSTLPGYPVDALNTSTQSWDENFFITFLEEVTPDEDASYEQYVDYLAAYKQHLVTYTKATISGGFSPIFEKDISVTNLPGDQMNCPMMLTKNVDGRLTLVYQQYEKSFFVDPSGMGGNEDITPDNNLIIEVYQIDDSYPRQMQLTSTTEIATTPSASQSTLYTFYGIGNLRYDEDVDFHHYSTDGSPAFVVCVDEYVTYDDDNYNSSYYVYDVNGQLIKTLAKNTFTYVLMSDIPGYEPQALFIHTGDEYTFQFVDLYSGETATEVDQMYRGYPLSTSIDRVPMKDGYAYAVATSYANVEDEEEGTLYAPVCWIDSDGEFIRIDNVPVGKDVELARFNIVSSALSPYVFNTDTDIEYMLLVKRHINGGPALREEFLIATPEKGAIHTFLPDEEKGDIRSVMLLPGSNPQLVITYLKNYKYITDSYSLPFTKFDGGSGTESDPYLIATAGDLMQMGKNPSSHFRLANDIDCTGATFYTIDEFSGSLDGNGHIISNLTLYGNGNVSLFGYCTEARFKDINFYDCNVALSGSGECALIANTALNSSFENIHIRRLSVTGESFSGQFAPVVCRAWLRSSINGCEISGAEINLPRANNVGGIAGDLRTGTSINACSFTGYITADNTIGGIVATTTTGDETITNCHVDANLTGCHTIGGVVGFLDRSRVNHCYVEGIIIATKASRWTKAYSVGGIAGELEGDWEGTSNVPVSMNLIGVSAIVVADENLEEDYPHQLSTVHRIVGRTSYNARIENDEFTDPTRPDVVYETGVINNYVVSDLAVIDPDFNEQTIEGTSISRDEVTDEFLQTKLGFAYGSSTEAPWNIQSWYSYDPSLWYESSICIPYSNIEVSEGSIFEIEIGILSRISVAEEDLLGDFSCEFDESVIEMTGGMGYDGKTMTIEFKALKEGKADFRVSMLGGSASCAVNVIKNGDSAVGELTTNTCRLTYSNEAVNATGCLISIFDMNGRKILSGIDRVETGSLTPGVYVATAVDQNGTAGSLKFVK